MGSRAGGAQVLLSSSCLLLLWHLSLSFPVEICPTALHVSWQRSPRPAETHNPEKRSLAKRIHPRQITGAPGKQRTQHVTLPKENRKRHVRTERNPNCQDKQLQTNIWSRCYLTHYRVRQERGSQPQPKLESSLQGNQTIWQRQMGREQDGSGLKMLGKARGKKKNKPPSEVTHSPPESSRGAP